MCDDEDATAEDERVTALTQAEVQEIVRRMRERHKYRLDQMAAEFGVCVKTLYRIYHRAHDA